MRKAQKIILILAFFTIALLFLYPPFNEIGPREVVLSQRRGFIFLPPKSTNKYWHFQLNFGKIFLETLGVAMLTGAIFIVVGLTPRRTIASNEPEPESELHEREAEDNGEPTMNGNDEENNKHQEHQEYEGHCCKKFYDLHIRAYIRKEKIHYSDEGGMVQSEDENYVILCYGSHGSMHLVLTYCPFCGKELERRND